jgi:phosphatidylglycerophosphatase A
MVLLNSCKMKVMSIFLRPDYGNTHLTASQILKNPVLLLAFGFGSGLLRKAPGTFGTLAAVPVYLIMAQGLPETGYLMLLALFFGLGVWFCHYAAQQLGVHDYGGIVWDEVVGLLITLAYFPFSWSLLGAGFVLFRLFDIAKPWPISWLDRHVHGGFGIMLDDVLAAILANLILRIWF